MQQPINDAKVATPGLRVVITGKIRDASKRLTDGVTTVKDKSDRIWKHVRSIPYELFSVTSKNVDDLIGGKGLTCYGKSLLQASMLESEGIPWRFEFSKCPPDRIDETIRVLGEKNPMLVKMYDNFHDVIKGKELLHTAVQVNIDGDWNRVDSTINPELCEKMRDPARKAMCLSADNVTAVHGCTVTGHGKEMPVKAINAWNGVSIAGNLINSFFKGVR